MNGDNRRYIVVWQSTLGRNAQARNILRCCTEYTSLTRTA